MSERLEILGIGVDRVTSDEALERIGTFIAEGREKGTTHQVVTANAEIIYRASKNEDMKAIINQAQMVTADGSGVVWASKQLGEPLADRVTGIDLVNSICAASAQYGWKLYILGSAPGVADTAAKNICEKYPGCNIIGTHHGYFDAQEEQNILAELRELKPDVLFVALGAPRQEYWIAEHIKALGIPVGMGIGGSMDVLSGNVKRAPEWMQKMSLEWLYRFLIQPTRFKRMLALPKFMLAVKKQK